jgi:hypothetical protein
MVVVPRVFYGVVKIGSLCQRDAECIAASGIIVEIESFDKANGSQIEMIIIDLPGSASPESCFVFILQKGGRENNFARAVKAKPGGVNIRCRHITTQGTHYAPNGHIAGGTGMREPAVTDGIFRDLGKYPGNAQYYKQKYTFFHTY